MPDEIRVGVAGLTHGHVWGLIQSWKRAEGTRLVAVADRTPLLEKARSDFETAYEDWRAMLNAEQLDALVVTSDNVESSEIAVEALNRGVPCMVEKAMAANAADADRMLEAMRTSGRTLMINWPLAWSPWMGELRRRVSGGDIGTPFHLRYRNGHSGPKEIGCDEYFVGWLYDETRNGGGAIADFGSYGAVLCRWLFGMPETVYCVRHNATKDYDVCDDHAVLTLKYPKLTAVLEATWATNAFDTGPNPVVFGRDGTLAVYGNALTRHQGGRDAETISLKEGPGGPAETFIECMRTGRQPEGILNPEISADGCRILDAAIRSAGSGCAERPS